jgi:hypothetical protein
MRLTGIREGDIVEVNDGIPYLAIVRGRQGRRLLVDPLRGVFHPAPVPASYVVTCWRRVGGGRAPGSGVSE